MRRIMISILIVSIAISGQWFSKEKDDLLIRAMKDEMKRTMAELKTDELSEPYYLSYGITDAYIGKVSASFGAILDELRPELYRNLSVDLRVGDRDFDNSNFESFNFSFGRSMGMRQSRMPVDDDYNVLRRNIWRTTDDMFKDAHNSLNSKIAALQSEDKEDRPADLTEEKKQTARSDFPDYSFDYDGWKQKVRDISRIFVDYPHLTTGTAQVSVSVERQIMVNSEGSEVIRNENFAKLVLSASAVDQEGREITEERTFDAFYENELPNIQEMEQAAKELADGLVSRIDGDSLISYTGPILFEDQAAGELWVQLVGARASHQWEFVTDNPRMKMAMGMMMPKTFTDRFERRTFPDYIDIYSDPTIEEYDGIPLLGSYEYDNEGIPGQRVKLVEEGMVVDVLRNRRPFKDFEHSNGHGRLGWPGAESRPVFSNLFVEAGNTEKNMKDRLIELAEDEGLEYTYILRRVFRPNDSATQMKTMMNMMGQPDMRESEIKPAQLWRVDVATGEETLVRGGKILNFDLRNMRDIEAVSDEKMVYNTSILAGNMITKVATVAPDAVLIEEVDLEPDMGAEGKPQLTESPFRR